MSTLLAPTGAPLAASRRKCLPEHAAFVRRSCLDAPELLPRWHDDERGRRDEHRGFHTTAPNGAYASIPVWQSREHWLTYIIPVAIARHADVLLKHHVSPDMLKQWATVKSGYAHSNGRRCIVRPDTLASVLETTPRHVQRINACAREIGLEVVIQTGRMLNLEESTGCRRRGSRQRGLSTEVALTTPTPVHEHVHTVTPTRGGTGHNNSHCYFYSPSAHPGAEKAQAPPARNRIQREPTRKARHLASQVVRKVPWLATERPGRIAPTLHRFANAQPAWTASDIALALNDHSTRAGLPTHINPDNIKTRPAALLAHMLCDLDTQADHPNLAPIPLESPRDRDHARCEVPDCDHGWIEQPDGRHARCPGDYAP